MNTPKSLPALYLEGRETGRIQHEFAACMNYQDMRSIWSYMACN